MDVKKIMSEMTLEEKASLLTGKRLWFFNGIKRLGIRDFIVSDGPHGIRAYYDFSESNGYPKTKAPATAFPSASCMASTWNESLIQEVGKTIAKECNHYKVDIVLGPGVNGKRSPLGGRNFEYYSEDPVLTAKMGINFVKGVQSLGVGTSLKHFVLNEQETLRRFISSNIDERTFRELYAYPFEQIIKEAKPLTVMAAYNKVNGIYACENPDTLTKMLRDEWSYQGLTISDWGGVQHKKASVLAGMDIEMPEAEWTQEFIKDVKNGLYPIDVIDKAVKRILEAYLWMLSNPNYGKQTDFEVNHQVAQRVAEEGIVLLKNNNHFLPLSKSDSIVVLGTYALHPRTHGGGSSELLAYKTEIPLEEINHYTNALYFEDYLLTDKSVSAIKKADKILIFTGTTTEIEHEGDDRVNLKLPMEQIEFVKSVSNINSNIAIVNNSGSAVEVKDFIGDVKAFIQSWFLGSASGKALAKILFGDVNPSGKLSETFPFSIENTSTYSIFPGVGLKTDYLEGLDTGYRYFDTHKIPVSFPFGHGLSYTTFDYSNVRLSNDKITHNEQLHVYVDVKNTGKISGMETIQIYIKFPYRLGTPEKVLKGFSKKVVEAGKTVTFEIILKELDFAGYYPEQGRFLVENGLYDLFIGTSVENIIHTSSIYFESTDQISLPLTLDQPVKAWIKSTKDEARIHNFLTNNRKIHFYEYEEPMDRIIRRIMNELGKNSLDIETYLKSI